LFLFYFHLNKYSLKRTSIIEIGADKVSCQIINKSIVIIRMC